VPGGNLDQLGLLAGAALHGEGAPRVEATVLREGRKVRRLAGDSIQRRLGAQLGDGVQQRFGIGVLGMVEQPADGLQLDDLPAYITATVSHILATIPRSCATKIRAMPLARCRSFKRLRYRSWMVMSRLVVGSSAMVICGPPAWAIAPTMRWRMPPLIWCGNSFMRAAGEGMHTAV
jgi:hypothetical protein